MVLQTTGCGTTRMRSLWGLNKNILHLQVLSRRFPAESRTVLKILVFHSHLQRTFSSTLSQLNQSTTGGVSEETFKCSAFPRGRQSFTKEFQNCLQIFPRTSKDSSAWKERQWGGNVTEPFKITSVTDNGIGNTHSLHRTHEQQIVN